MKNMNENNMGVSNNNFKSIVIIGGGVGGLFSAWKLSEKGYKVTVLEQKKVIGGLSSSISHNGYQMDIGPHYITIPKKSDLLIQMKDLMGENNMIEIPNIHDAYRTFFRGKISKKYPTLYETIRNNGIKFTIKSLYELIISKILNFRKNSFESSQDYLVSTFGNFLYKKWFVPYLKFSFGDTNVSLKIIMERFPPISLKKFFRVLKNKIKQSEFYEQKNSTNGINEYFHWYPKLGMSSIINSLERKIIENKGKINVESSVVSINHDENSKVVTYVKNNREIKLNADIIIYATPLNIVKKWIFKENKNIKINDKSIHSIVSFFCIDSPQVFDGWVITIYDTDLPFFRISQQNYLSKDIAPKNKSLLSIESKVTDNDELWNMDDHMLFSVLEKNLKSTGILHDEIIDDFKNIKIQNLYSINSTIDSNEDSLEITKKINEFKNEFLLGTTELDVGRLVSDDPHKNSNSKISLGGVFVALANADSLVKQIVSKIS
jgi:protoporphyrinogen oxidase